MGSFLYWIKYYIYTVYLSYNLYYFFNHILLYFSMFYFCLSLLYKLLFCNLYVYIESVCLLGCTRYIWVILKKKWKGFSGVSMWTLVSCQTEGVSASIYMDGSSRLVITEKDVCSTYFCSIRVKGAKAHHVTVVSVQSMNELYILSY